MAGNGSRGFSRDFSETSRRKRTKRPADIGESLPNDVYCKRLLAETSGRANIMRRDNGVIFESSKKKTLALVRLRATWHA